MIASADPTKEPGLREDDVLERIAKIVSHHAPPPGEVHVGDDAAVLLVSEGAQSVISVDVSVADVHLAMDLFSLYDLGYKAVASALSDLAAMGATARAVVVGVVAPSGTDLDELHQGVADAALAGACAVVGGDLSEGRQLSVAVTVVGECAPGRSLSRRGAQPGDALLVTGPLGSAAAGLRRRRDGADLNDELVLAHRRPTPRLEEGVAAVEAGAHAMMDLSDGLGVDLHRLADASAVGFRLVDIPVALGATLEEATSGGEDYELLIATDAPEALAATFRSRGLRPPLVLGVVDASTTRRELRGVPFPRRGFEHHF